ncbi:MAG: hypothetical protein U5J99_10230 [Parvularculaceae bacterium]|nr:hypothetical protein [Parvularculaceae bacterium]
MRDASFDSAYLLTRSICLKDLGSLRSRSSPTGKVNPFVSFAGVADTSLDFAESGHSTSDPILDT